MDLVLRKSGKKTKGKLKVSDAVFAVDYNESLVHQILTSFVNGSRRGTKTNKSRSQVRGGGRKPWRQKGTGRARAGTIRSPLWRGGGVTFAASPRKYKNKVNRKMYRAAIRSILSELTRQERLSCVDSLDLKEPRTKEALAQLDKFGLTDVLVITDEINENLYLATRNIPAVDVIDTTEIDPYRLVGYDHILITQPAVEKVEAWLS